MTDLPAAIAAAREALAKYQAGEIRHYIDEALCDLITAIAAAQGEAVAWKITLADNTGTYDYAQRAGLQAPQAPSAAVPAPEVLVRAYFHRFSEVEDDYTIYHTLDGVCEQCIPVLIMRDDALAAANKENNP